MVIALGVIGYLLVGVVVFLIGAHFDSLLADADDELPVIGLAVLTWPAPVLLALCAAPVLAVGWLARKAARLGKNR